MIILKRYIYIYYIELDKSYFGAKRIRGKKEIDVQQVKHY